MPVRILQHRIPHCPVFRCPGSKQNTGIVQIVPKPFYIFVFCLAQKRRPALFIILCKRKHAISSRLSHPAP